MRLGVSTVIVSTGTWRRIWKSLSPCGVWLPWKPQMPRSVVAPAASDSRRRWMSAWCDPEDRYHAAAKTLVESTGDDATEP